LIFDSPNGISSCLDGSLPWPQNILLRWGRTNGGLLFRGSSQHRLLSQWGHAMRINTHADKQPPATLVQPAWRMWCP
jgi:hypothetical protein